MAELEPDTSKSKPSKPTASSPGVWSGFYKKAIKTRLDQLQLMYPQLKMNTLLPNNIADNMVENCIGTMSLPLGLGLNFIVNGKEFVVPMSTEEPSVVAAVSGAAKTIGDNGGFKTTYSGNVMVSQVQVLNVADPEKAKETILLHKAELMEEGNRFCRTMLRRGGGMRDIVPRILPYDRKKYFTVHTPSDGITKLTPSGQPVFDKSVEVFGGDSNAKPDNMLVVHLLVDVCESMGANTVNTVAEGLAPAIQELVGGGCRVGLKIVTNYCVERRASAKFVIPVSKLGYKGKSGESVASGIIEGYALAYEDIYRAVTHNKGIMNGVDAVAIALGQDFRALEAGAHAWASRDGTYRPLTSYRFVKKGKELCLEGFLELPVPIGTRGGSIQSHPAMEYTHGLLYNPNCADLGEILVAVGLAQNFAALRALASEGIQRGHMSLHSRNIAIQAGAPPELVPEVSAYMIARGKISVNTARDYLLAHSILQTGTKHRYKRRDVPPSTLFVELELEEISFSINVVFESIGEEEVHLMIKDDASPSPVQRLLFGEQRNVTWFKQIFALLQNLDLANKAPKRSNLVMSYKAKLLSMLMNLLVYRLIKMHPKETSAFIENILSAVLNPLSIAKQMTHVETIRIGFPLLYELWNVFKNQIDQTVNVKPLVDALKEEQNRVFHYCTKSIHINNATTFEEFMRVHSRRWQVTMFLLCDMQQVGPNLVNTESIHFMFRLGQYLEWEGTIAQDIGVWQRDYETGENNSYVFWLRVNNKQHSEPVLEEFLKFVEQRSAKKMEKLLKEKHAAQFFDLSIFLDSSIPVVQRYFQLVEIMKLAKL
eukprot:TRINITY_DN1728_c0_g1_i1.p1 TRINITY_DN1728_c0_g1~~TRINITY_DN1728_c0_g1_i1.p1  ORF type:complete len:824 (+),score=163.68 TRINITY_DN1728_c0_g1_i1:965-3436(+)